MVVVPLSGSGNPESTRDQAPQRARPRLGVVMPFGPMCTRVRVIVEGIHRYSVNTRASKYSYRRIWAQTWTTEGPHVETLRHAGSSGRFIGVDRLLPI